MKRSIMLLFLILCSPSTFASGFVGNGIRDAIERALLRKTTSITCFSAPKRKLSDRQIQVSEQQDIQFCFCARGGRLAKNKFTVKVSSQTSCKELQFN